MKKVVSLITVLFVSIILAQGQNSDKEIVYIENFSRTSSIGTAGVEALRNKVIAGMMNTNRFLVKDINSESSLKREEKKQTEDASNVDESTLIIMKNLHAKYLIQGHVTVMESTLEKNSDGSTYYSGTVAYTLKIVDIATGTLKGSEDFKYSGMQSGTGSTRDEAIMATMKLVENSMDKFVEQHFPIEGSILEISAEKKGKATEVYIDLGSKHGMEKGQKFKVYEEREAAGRTIQKEIGEIKIESVDGIDISLCKVGKGGEEIKQAVGLGNKITIKSVYDAGPIWKQAQRSMNL